MKPMLKFKFIIVLLFILTAEYALAEETINWFVIQLPPSMVLDESGKKITGGAAGNVLLMLQSELKEYSHNNVQMNWARFWNDVGHGKNICNSILYKTPERVSAAEFSIPVAFILPVHMVLRKETYTAIGSPASISLIDIMKSKTLKGGLINKRSYSEQIDALLKSNEKNTGISRHVVDVKRLVMMLMHKRFDYTLEYPPGIDFALMNMTKEEKISDLVMVPVKEIGSFYYVYIGCTKNEWGKNVINDLNAALEKLRPSIKYKDALKEIYSGDSLKKANDIYKNHFVNSGGE